MEIVRDFLLNKYQPAVRSYSPGEILIHEKTYHSSLVVTPKTIYQDWMPQTCTELTAAHLARLLTLAPPPRPLLIGTGEQQQFPDRDILAPLLAAGVGFEIMDTAAACRTWNVVLSEGRDAAVVLLLR